MGTSIDVRGRLRITTVPAAMSPARCEVFENMAVTVARNPRVR